MLRDIELLLGKLGPLLMDVLEELVFQATVDVGAHFGVLHEHGTKKVDAGFGVEAETVDVVVDLTGHVQVDDVILILAVERWLTIQEEVKDHSE